jgi:superfamily II DNA or RNA helicase
LEIIGQIGGGKNNPSGIIDIATIQSLQGKEIIKNYGQIIVDECHHISAFSFVMKIASGKYVHGFTATPIRKEGLHPLMIMQCGLIRFKVDPKEQAATKDNSRGNSKWWKTQWNVSRSYHMSPFIP